MQNAALTGPVALGYFVGGIAASIAVGPPSRR
jgi:hypothetical protein